VEDPRLVNVKPNIISEGQKEPIDPSAELLDATYRLGQVFRRHGRHWRNARYSIHLQRDGNWKYTVDFGY
jgi:hypothetical protein